MHIGKLTINGFKCFSSEFEVRFGKGLTLLVGENGSGKSAIIDALRLILQEDEFGRKGINEGDFHKGFGKDAGPVDGFGISVVFNELTAKEQVAYLPWTDLEGHASLTLEVENRINYRGRYQWSLWGGASKASAFERELFETIECVYLPPLRDAEAKLRAGRGSRLSRLLKNISKKDLADLKKDGKDHPLVVKAKDYNKSLIEDKSLIINKANELIRQRLMEAVGSSFSQDTSIRFTPPDFNRIVENLCLLFFPNRSPAESELFRALEENSLGYNNLLYLATVLAELTADGEEGTHFKVLLIEEPEAHLHPQLQIQLLRYLSDQCAVQDLQVVVSSHSPVLAASADIASVVCLTRNSRSEFDATRIEECGLSQESTSFINRWLDATKSTLLFAKGIILVEGIAEALLLPELAKKCLLEYNSKVEKVKKDGGPAKEALGQLPASLDDAGVSVINMGGIYFKHFLQLFCNLAGSKGANVPIRCAGLTDRDPAKAIETEETDKNGKKIWVDVLPTRGGEYEGKNHALKLTEEVNKSPWARLFANELMTFEYDLAMHSGNLSKMSEALLSIWPREGGEIRKRLEGIQSKDWSKCEDLNEKAVNANEILKRIEDDEIGKGLYAQVLADMLKKEPAVKIAIPAYIAKAVVWACGGDVELLS